MKRDYRGLPGSQNITAGQVLQQEPVQLLCDVEKENANCMHGPGTCAPTPSPVSPRVVSLLQKPEA